MRRSALAAACAALVGIGTAAAQPYPSRPVTLIDQARSQQRHRFMHAFPSVENTASNAICRKLGFSLIEVCQFEYPHGSGNFMQCNDWRLDLFAQ